MSSDYDTCGTQIDGKWCSRTGRVWVRIPAGPNQGLRTPVCKKHAPLYEEGAADRQNLSIVSRTGDVVYEL